MCFVDVFEVVIKVVGGIDEMSRHIAMFTGHGILRHCSNLKEL